VDVMKELLTLLTVAGDNVAPLVLSIFTFIGRQKPIGETPFFIIRRANRAHCPP
jgi:hypothetical protein